MKKGLIASLTLLVTLSFAFLIPSLVSAAEIVPASCTAGNPVPLVPGDLTITPSGIYQFRDWGFFRTAAILTIDGTNYNVYSVNTFDATYNPSTKVIVMHYDAIWYVGDGHSASDNGFKGNIEMRLLGYNLVTSVTSDIHATFQGFGSFEGQTMVLSYEGPSATQVFTGVDIIR